MFRKTVLLLVSLVITVCLLLFTDLSVAYIDKTTPYSVAFEFDGELPQFKTHQLALGFSSGHDIQAYQKIYHDSMMEYEENCGAMAHGIPSNRDTYAWLDDPWPWEYSKN